MILTARLLATFLIFFSLQSFSQVVTSVAEKAVTLNTEKKNIQAGDQFVLIDANNKRRAIISIEAVGDGVAYGSVLKGKAEVGQMARRMKKPVAQNTKAEAPTKTSPPPVAEKSKRRKHSGQAWGVYGGIINTNISFQAQYDPSSTIGDERVSNVAFKGSGFGLKGFFDYDITPSLTANLAVGYEPFNTSGSGQTSNGLPICSDGTTTSCTVSLNYLSLAGQAQYNFYSSGLSKYYAGLGYSLLVGMSKSINVQNLSTAGATNNAILLSGGGQVQLSPKSFIPFQLMYAMFSGTGVSANQIQLWLGYGKAL